MSRVVSHELGHALWDLEDEYDTGICNPQAFLPWGPNVAAAAQNPLPWASLMTPVAARSLPTDDGAVGVYMGALYCPFDMVRPSPNCHMRSQNKPEFCTVCRAHIQNEFAKRTGECQPQGSCSHSECSVGGALTKSCGVCASSVCVQHPECCDPAHGWTELCVRAAQELPGPCRGICFDNKSTCSHSVCEAGVALPTSCSTCVASVCKRDKFCCTNKWDHFCTSEAKQDPFCKCS
jgi:hypothetical protein